MRRTHVFAFSLIVALVGSAPGPAPRRHPQEMPRSPPPSARRRLPVRSSATTRTLVRCGACESGS